MLVLQSAIAQSATGFARPKGVAVTLSMIESEMAVRHTTSKPDQLQWDKVMVVHQQTGTVLGHATVDHYAPQTSDGDELSKEQRAQQTLMKLMLAVDREGAYRDNRHDEFRVIADTWVRTVTLGPAPTHAVRDYELENEL